jgi:DNA-binding MarR family transcriptional regulator
LQLQLIQNTSDENSMTNRQPDLWFSFVRAHRVLIREIERRLDEAGLPAYAWYDVLWGIESGEGSTRRMHELADTLAIERYNLTRLVDRLEQENLVVRTRSSEDGRAAFVTITDAGRALRKKMWKVYQAAVAENFLSQFKDADQAATAEALDRAAAMARGQGQN